MTRKEHTAFAERLRTLLEAANVEVKPVVLEKLLARRGVSVTAQAISGWLSGRHMPKPDAMRALAFLAGVEPHWLQFGKPAQGVGEERLPWPAAASGEDRMAVEAYLALSPTQREAIRNLIHLLAAPPEKPGR